MADTAAEFMQAIDRNDIAALRALILKPGPAGGA